MNANLLCLFIYYQKQRYLMSLPHQKRNNISNAKPNAINQCPNCSRLAGMEMELAEAYNHIRVLKANNREILDRLDKQEQNKKKIIVIQDENSFLKMNLKQLKDQINNYQTINQKLRSMLKLRQGNQQKAINSIVNTPKKQETEKVNCFMNIYQNNSLKKDFQKNNNNKGSAKGRSPLSDMKINQNQREPKKNHLITPKSRMKLDWTSLNQNDESSFQKINAMRRAFM